MHKTVVNCSMLAKHKENKIQPFLQRVARNGRAQKDKGKLGHMGLPHYSAQLFAGAWQSTVMDLHLNRDLDRCPAGLDVMTEYRSLATRY